MIKLNKTIKRSIAGTILTFLVGIIGLITLIFQPQIVFAHKIEHGQFRIYSDYKINKNAITNIVDAALELVKTSELYDKDYQYKIIFCHKTFYNTIDNLIFDPYAAARATSNNVVVKIHADIEKGYAQTERSKIDLVYMFAHEMIHCLQENKYGKIKFNPFSPPPMWKLEGYPEYISRQPHLQHADYDLKAEIQRYINFIQTPNDGWIQSTTTHFVPLIYFKGRIMTEYLMDIKGLTYDALLQDKVQEKAVFQEMVEWSKL